MSDEPATIQKLGAEAIGTAMLVFIGVGSVPATLILNGDSPMTMADLGMISLAFGTIVIATEIMPRSDRKSTRLNSSHVAISYAVFCLKKKKDQRRACARRGRSRAALPAVQ